MKKFFAFLFTAAILAAPLAVAADSYGLDAAQQSSGLPKQVAKASDIPSVVGNIIGVGLSLLGVVFFGLMLYAGILWMTARGDTGKVDSAKNILEAAIIGLLIVAGSYAISNFVFTEIVRSGQGG